MRVALVLSSLLFTGSIYSQETSFEDFKRQRLSQQQSFTTQHYSAFKAYKKKHREELQAFKKAVSEKWGYSDVSTQNTMVIYSDTFNEKVIIDFANNDVSVSNTDEGNEDRALQLLNNVLAKDINEIKDTKQITLLNSLKQ